MNSILQMRLVVRAGWKGSIFLPARSCGTTRREARQLWYHMRTGRTRGKQTGIQIQVRVQPEQVAPLDAWIADQPDPKPTRPEAIRYALTDWLTGQGYVRHREDPEGAN
ncbi:hypothetical protein FV242_28860 [Methylobacterium sp. WL64]|nr:hypothetical protein FV242_28860 [Methylobacterium sp. WL64]